jgi:hypothetical protein
VYILVSERRALRLIVIEWPLTGDTIMAVSGLVSVVRGGSYRASSYCSLVGLLIEDACGYGGNSSKYMPSESGSLFSCVLL